MAATAAWDEVRREYDYFASFESELRQLAEQEVAALRELLRLTRELVK
jgi:hypothetical protein